VSTETLRLKKDIYMVLDKALRAANKTINSVFRRVDKDGSD